MSEIAVIQPSSSLYYLSESMCNLDVSNTLRYTNKTPTAPIFGKKIISELKIALTADDKPPPFQIFVKKQKRDKSNPRSGKKKKHTTLKSCSNRIQNIESKTEIKKIQLKKNLVHYPPKPGKNKSSMKNKIPHKESQKENEKIPPPARNYSSNINAIIKTTLKKEQVSKIKQEKEKKGLEELKEIRKIELSQQNIQIREENAKFKKRKFNPKHGWGVDQSRLRDPSRGRSRADKHLDKRPKSSERVRTGLDIIKEIQMELGVSHFRSRSLSQKSENNETQSKRSPWQPNPEVKAYMKKQELCRKQKIIYEGLHKFAEESRRRAQLQQLEQINKSVIIKKKNKKPKKKLAKRKKTKTTENNQEVIPEDSQEEHKSISLVYDSELAERSIPHMDLRVPNISKISKKPLKDLSDNFDDYSEKILNTNSHYEEDEFSQNSDEEDLRNYAASRIQGLVRGFLVRRRMERVESYSSVDNQVKNIISRWSKHDSPSKTEQRSEDSNSSSLAAIKKVEKKDQRPLVIDIPSSDSDRIPTPFSDSQESDIRNGSNLESFREAQEKKIEYQEKLKEQLIWREAQMHSLEYLKQKEIKDMQLIAQRVGKSEELGELLSSMVEKRYDQLSSLFEENLRDVQDALVQDMNTEERAKFEETLEEKREEFSKLVENDSKTVEEYIEDIISRNNLSQSDSSAENRPVIYKPKSSRPDFPYEYSEIIPNPPLHALLSPNQRDFTINQESTIRQLSSEESQQESLTIFTRDMQISPSASSSSSTGLMKQLQILTPSPTNSSRKKKAITPETPPSSSREQILDPILIEEGPLDMSNSVAVQDNSLLEQLQPEFQGGSSYTPDYIPERPSAPLQYFDSGRESPTVYTSPGIYSSSENDVRAEENSDVEWVTSVDCEITPELVVEVAERILLQLIAEEKGVASHRREVPELPIVNMVSIGTAPEGSTSSEPKIQTDSVAVRDYVEEVFAHSDLNELVNNLKNPLRKKPLDLLNRMQEIEIGTIVETEVTVFPEVLSVNLYLALENNLENSTRRSNSPHMQQLIIEAEHIHNKMIFDAANEVLQRYRPYGTQGAPLPWSISDRRIGANKPIKVVIEEVKEVLLDWSSIQAGKICTEDMLLSNGVLDEELLQQIREERLASMLAEEIIEKDWVWINYEFEETQAKLDIADMILEHIAGEVISILG